MGRDSAGNITINIQIGHIKTFMLLPEQLYEHIPNKVQKWSAKDVEKWFTLNNIQTCNQFSFTREQFDGPAFISVTPEYLMQRCGVVSRIVMKKIIEWLEYDREDFEEYVDQHFTANCSSEETKTPPSQECLVQVESVIKKSPSKSKIIQEIEFIPSQNDKINTPRNMFDHIQRHAESIKPIEVQKWKKKKPYSEESLITEKVSSSRENSKKLSNKSENCIPIGANFVKSSYEILQNIIEFKVNSKSQFLNNSGKIGRNNINDIIILADSVSRRHAEIVKDKDDFYIKDSDSKYGTFVQIGTKNRRFIYQGDIIAFQDYEIEVMKYKFYRSNNTFQLKVRKKGERDATATFFNKKYVLVGKEGKDISINEPTICPTHARITFDTNGQLIIIEQQGKCFKKLKKDQLLKIDEKDKTLRFGLSITEIKLLKNHKPVPNISQFDFYQH